MTARTDAGQAQRAAATMATEQFAAVSTIFDAAEMVISVADMDTHELLFMNAQAERNWGADWLRRRCYEVLQSGRSGPCEFCTNHRLVEHGRPAKPVVWEFQNTVNQHWYLCIDCWRPRSWSPAGSTWTGPRSTWQRRSAKSPGNWAPRRAASSRSRHPLAAPAA